MKININIKQNINLKTKISFTSMQHHWQEIQARVWKEALTKIQWSICKKNKTNFQYMVKYWGTIEWYCWRKIWSIWKKKSWEKGWVFLNKKCIYATPQLCGGWFKQTRNKTGWFDRWHQQFAWEQFWGYHQLGDMIPSLRWTSCLCRGHFCCYSKDLSVW